MKNGSMLLAFLLPSLLFSQTEKRKPQCILSLTTEMGRPHWVPESDDKVVFKDLKSPAGTIGASLILPRKKKNNSFWTIGLGIGWRQSIRKTAYKQRVIYIDSFRDTGYVHSKRNLLSLEIPVGLQWRIGKQWRFDTALAWEPLIYYREYHDALNGERYSHFTKDECFLLTEHLFSLRASFGYDLSIGKQYSLTISPLFRLWIVSIEDRVDADYPIGATINTSSLGLRFDFNL